MKHWTVVFMLVLVFGSVASAATLEEGLALKKAGKLPEAEAILAEVVKEHPDNAVALEQWATVLGWLGRHDDSIAAWRRVLVLKPDDVDDNMGLARVQYWKGDYAPARARMDALLKRIPTNVDALILAGDICNAAHDISCARNRYNEAEKLTPSPEIEKKLAQTVAPPAWRLDAGGQVDSYDNTRGIEGSFFGQASWKAADPLVLSGGYEQLHQFGFIDHRFNLGAYVAPIDPLLLNVKLAVSPTAHAVANWELVAGVELKIAGPVTALANERHLDFSDQGVTIVGGGARLDFAKLNLSLQGGAVTSTEFPTEGYITGRVEVYATDDVHVYAAAARGGQTLRDPTGVTIIETATDFAAGVTWQIDAIWGIRLDYSYEKFGDSFVRNSLGSALTYKF